MYKMEYINKNSELKNIYRSYNALLVFLQTIPSAGDSRSGTMSQAESAEEPSDPDFRNFQ